jgi:1-deoxy-D-xylulose-5-phosphate reductoisomerase
MPKTRLSILGATGSVGGSALSVAGAFPERFEVVALAAGKNIRLLFELIRRFQPACVSVFGEGERAALSRLIKESPPPRAPEIGVGGEGLRLAATLPEADIVVSAVSGSAGLAPTFAALRAGKRTALANKESLVAAGGLLTDSERRLIAPVDSEHSAIFQALGGSLDASKVRRLILTASGGPFLGWSAEMVRQAGKAAALRHPNWSMGKKITVDSATLLNKGFEVIEARHLFQVPYGQISVKIHPESVIHSLVEHRDGSLIAQMGAPDMRVAAAYALTHPERLPLLENSEVKGFHPFSFGRSLTFREPDRAVFPCLALAEGAGREGGDRPAVLAAAGEAAVGAFLADRLPFWAISEVIAECLDRVPPRGLKSLEDALEADRAGREFAESVVRRRSGL